jgi:hypothetical protein
MRVRIEVLRCDDALRGADALNLGASRLIAKWLTANLERWLGGSRRADQGAVWLGVNDILHHRRAGAGGRRDRADRHEADRAWIKGSSGWADPDARGREPQCGAGRNKGLVRLQQALDASRDMSNRSGNVDRVTLLPVDVEAIPRSKYRDAVHSQRQGGPACMRAAVVMARQTVSADQSGHS